MEFNSFLFFGFLFIVLFFFYITQKQYRKYILLISSYAFYAAWDWRFCGLILFSTLVDYFAAQKIEQYRSKDPRIFLVLSLVTNLGILGFFKYFDFFVQSFGDLTGLDSGDFVLNIVLPVGISFFTFQSMSYTIDVYKGKIKARRVFSEFALFVAFFPQLVAGPIVRAVEFFPQFDYWKRPSVLQVQQALSLILLGLLKKIVFADNFAMFSDEYFSAPYEHPGFLPALTGIMAFSAQIYFDFSGYSDIAIGIAKLLGFNFPINFRRPYLSLNVSEFWTRWHISLSSWLRDYLYISLGGNRYGRLLTYRNLLITMVLGGLWHGASWNFVVWGGLHGAYLIAHRSYCEYIKPVIEPRLAPRVYKILCWLVTLVLINTTWVFFRSRELADSIYILSNLFPTSDLGISMLPMAMVGMIAFILLVTWIEEKWGVFDRLNRAHYAIRGIFIWLVLVLMSVFSVADTHIPFLYFQF